MGLPGTHLPALARTGQACRIPARRAASVLFAGLLGCTAVVDRFSGRGDACAILATGTPAMATIAAIHDTGITVNNDPVVDFDLDVQPAGGKPFRSAARALVSRLAVPRIQPGRTLPVKYDPAQPGRAAIDAWDYR